MGRNIGCAKPGQAGGDDLQGRGGPGLPAPPEEGKVGHAGTLDPLASGVLVVCVGSATRLIEYVQRMPKAYRTVVRLGARSDTLDADGRIEVEERPSGPDRGGGPRGPGGAGRDDRPGPAPVLGLEGRGAAGLRPGQGRAAGRAGGPAGPDRPGRADLLRLAPPGIARSIAGAGRTSARSPGTWARRWVAAG